ncbi:MAG: hypothetical protein CR964_00170 [Rhodobacterales bacterium]|nr:MAG: hypothetical protein CR964_00170 [Rhodobacterales bacterium]
MITVQVASTSWWFLPVVTPIAIWAAWSDLARMRIPNLAVLALIAVTLPLGFLALPAEEWLFRLINAPVVLAIGFVFFAAGAMGAGDAKYAAAAAPLFDRQDLPLILVLTTATLLAGFTLHRTIRRIPALRRQMPDWHSWERKEFPMGLVISGVILFYLLIVGIYGQKNA